MKTVWLGLLAWAALLVLQLVWHAWLAPPASNPLAPTLALALVPLLLPLLALRNKRRALLWAAVASLLYFSHGVAELWMHPDLRLLAALEVAFSLAVILAAGFDRPRKRAAELA